MKTKHSLAPMRPLTARLLAGARRGTLVVAAAAGLAACTSTVEQHGHVLPERVVSELKPGLVTRDGVVALLGTPSTVAPFDDKVWYYISEDLKTVAFLRPDVVDRTVLVLRFDDEGMLSDVSTLDADAGTEVAVVTRETPTAGHELTFLEQLLGNVGRFNSAPSNGSVLPGPGSGGTGPNGGR
ncbi:outer membrane protein assembly factor BamE (lipoprotein component of BamABCDE complex) [Constrictibacter sp. MBR-5]|uniref:outer membrane protein assembly factor BamE n=1 Tax=Constrictibacter sp. MBR-5 TaxID=3156467 RepID=UPI003399380B